MAKKTPTPRIPGSVCDVIYRPWITLPNGTKLYAKQFGKKVFRIPITEDQAANYRAKQAG